MDDDSDRFQNQAIDVSGRQDRVHNVIPGSYNLFVLMNDGNVLPSIPLDVVDRNIENVSATLETGVDLHGRVTLDGVKPGDRFSKNSIQLATLDELPGVGRQRFPINPDTETGEFTLRSLLPGRYVLQLAAFRAPDIYVADTRMGQDSVFDSGFTIGGKSRGSLEVVMKSQGGIVSGKVLDSTRLRPALYSTVVLGSRVFQTTELRTLQADDISQRQLHFHRGPTRRLQTLRMGIRDTRRMGKQTFPSEIRDPRCRHQRCYGFREDCTADCDSLKTRSIDSKPIALQPLPDTGLLRRGKIRSGRSARNGSCRKAL